MALPIRLGVLRGLVKEISVDERKPLLVGGARELAAVLAKELGRDAQPGAVRADDEPKGGAVFVYVLGREPTEADERALKRARRARVPIVAVVAGPVSDEVTIPYVLATDVVRRRRRRGLSARGDRERRSPGGWGRRLLRSRRACRSTPRGRGPARRRVLGGATRSSARPCSSREPTCRCWP